MPRDEITFMIEGANIGFLNFSGAEAQYNDAGDRNFVIFLDEDTAKNLARDGWNIKSLKSREEDEPDTPYIPVEVKFKAFPPKITVLTESSRTMLTEETVNTLDWAEIQNVDLIIRGYQWDVNGKQGIKAYLKTMFVTIDEDPLEKKYANFLQEPVD